MASSQLLKSNTINSGGRYLSQTIQPKQGSTLKAVLEQTKNQSHLALNDMYFGDEGCSLVAEFIATNSNLQQLECRGNNISPSGFAIICEELKKCTLLKSLLFEWNNIGHSSQGMNSLYSLLKENSSIVAVDLRNNKICQDDAPIIANIIRSNQTVQSLDLRWNDIGNDGGKLLSTSLQENNILTSLELAGNNISQDTMKQINLVLDKNRSGRDYTREEIDKLKTFQVTKNENQQPFGAAIPSQIQQLEKNQLHHMQMDINKERQQQQEVRSRLEVDLQNLMRQDKDNSKIISDLDNRCKSLLQENEILKQEIMHNREQMNLIQHGNADTLRIQEDRLRKHEEELSSIERQHRIQTDQLTQEHAIRIKEISRDWETRCRSLEERIKNLQAYFQLIYKVANDDLLQESRRLNEQMLTIKVMHEDDCRDLETRIHEEEYNKYLSGLKSLDSRMQALEQGRELLNRKNDDLSRELQLRDKKTADEMYLLSIEVDRLKSENLEFSHRSNEFEMLSDKLKNDLAQRDNMIDKLENEINSINTQVDIKKQENKASIDRLISEHREQKISWDDQRDAQMARIQDLERNLRSTHSENVRLRQEYQRLSELLQSTVSKTILQTFTENNYV